MFPIFGTIVRATVAQDWGIVDELRWDLDQKKILYFVNTCDLTPISHLVLKLPQQNELSDRKGCYNFALCILQTGWKWVNRRRCQVVVCTDHISIKIWMQQCPPPTLKLKDAHKKITSPIWYDDGWSIWRTCLLHLSTEQEGKIHVDSFPQKMSNTDRLSSVDGVGSTVTSDWIRKTGSSILSVLLSLAAHKWDMYHIHTTRAELLLALTAHPASPSLWAHLLTLLGPHSAVGAKAS